MKVSQAYKNYNIPLNLQQHMLRVAALAQIIVEDWTGKPIDKKVITFACLFHDAAKLIKFDLSKPERFGKEAAKIDFWRRVQKEMIQKYGDQEHKATIKMCREIGLPQKTIQLIDDLEWVYIPRVLEKDNLESGVAIYADMRIGFHGILSLKERLDDLKNRAQEDFEKHLLYGRKLETVIQENAKLNLNAIDDKQVNSRFDRLLDLEIPH